MKTSRHHTVRHVINAVVMLTSMAWQSASAATLTLTGEQEVPPVITSGRGTGEFTVAADGTISGSITTKGVPGTKAHIHQGSVGVNGPVIITLIQGEGGVWQVPPATRLTAEQMALYRAGGLYVNVHTETNKNGEVRAQLVP